MSTIEPIHVSNNNQAAFLASEVRPQRASLTINCLIPVLLHAQPCLVLHNFDPKNWNQWYPPFTFYHCDVPHELSTAFQLKNFVEKQSSLAPLFTNGRLVSELSTHVRSTMQFNNLEIVEPPLVDRDYWLKFSNSRKQWTLYCFYFFVARGFAPNAYEHFLSLNDVAVVPINESAHKGLAVVENLIELLASKDIRENIVRHAISLA